MGMGLGKDKLRNLTLTFLVFLSFLLSFNLWTAGRKIGEEENPSNQSVRSNISTIEHSESEAFRPATVALHGVDPENSLMIAETFPLRNLLENWFYSEDLIRVEDSSYINSEEYQEMMESNQWIEFIFREELPLGIFEQKFDDLTKEYENEYFNRILINVEDRNDVYFYNTETSSFYTVAALEDELINIDPFLNMENLNYKAAELQHIGNNLIYLTKESMEVPYRSYVIDSVPNSKYTTNFYPDPSLVDTRTTETTTRYIDLTREVTINQQDHTLVYLRQIEDSGDLQPTERFIKSFEQVNRFENWTGSFALTDYDVKNEVVSFRREIDGLPVFSPSDNETVSEVGLVESGVTHLKLPLRYINTPITMEENASEELLPGIEVSDRLLKELSPEKHDKIEVLTVGYTWKESEEADQVIYFIPDWYVLYDGVWIEFESLLEIQGEVAYGF